MNHILECHDIVKTDYVRGENCYLYDARGKRYVDFESGIWCTALGHTHPRIKQVMQAQIETGAAVSITRIYAGQTETPAVLARMSWYFPLQST